MLAASYPDADIRPQLEPNLGLVKGSEIHLGKTIMNLVINAVESLTEKGKVSIITSNCTLTNPRAGYDEIPTGRYVKLTVADNGSGIGATDIQHIFEPFYTQKNHGTKRYRSGDVRCLGDHQGP